MLNKLKKILRDPIVQGTMVGFGSYFVFLTIFQLSSSPPNMQVNLPKDLLNELIEGKALYFESNLGELVLVKSIVS